MRSQPSAQWQGGAALFKEGMKKWLTGVSLVTASREGTAYGLISTNFCQVGTDPPILLICVNNTASSCEPIEKSGAFCVNVLASHHQDLFDRFLKPARREERFVGGEWRQGVQGLPVLAGGLATFQCEVKDTFHRAAQTIFMGQVREVSIHTDRLLAPLCFFDGALR